MNGLLKIPHGGNVQSPPSLCRISSTVKFYAPPLKTLRDLNICGRITGMRLRTASVTFPRANSPPMYTAQFQKENYGLANTYYQTLKPNGDTKY